MTKLLAVDLGTTLIKCVLYSDSGEILAAESIPCTLTHPEPKYAEQDAELWYTGVCESISRIVASCGAEDIAGLSISSQGISVVPVDEAFRPLCPAISWLDMRADDACNVLLDQHSAKELFQKTGKFLSPSYTLPKLLWLKMHEPNIFNRAKMFLLPMDFVNARMTGRPVTDHTMASGTMVYNIPAGDWDDSLLALAGVRQEQFAEILPSGAFVGTINEETAYRTGLPRTVKVFNGGQDQKVAAYGAQITSQCATLSLGTAGALEIFVKDASAQAFLPFFPYISSKQTLVEGCVNTTGAAISWFKETIAPEFSFDDLNRLAANAPIGCNGTRFYPHLSRPGTPHKNCNEFGSLHGISLATSRGDLFRSLYEGLAYEFRLNLEYAQKAGNTATQLLLFGGASKSTLFCQIISNVTGLTVLQCSNSEMSSVGAAKLAAQGLRLDAELFAKTAAGALTCFSPEPKAVRQYNSLFKEYIKQYQSEE